jgi:hypothetical protein
LASSIILYIFYLFFYEMVDEYSLQCFK